MTQSDGTRGAVVAGHPLAAATGVEVLENGGNAMDAAVAMATVLCVVRPHMCGLGGDALALYLESATGKISALNGSGRAGSLATPEFFSKGAGRGSPALNVTVPGVVRAYWDAHERFGSLPFSDLLRSAITLARKGFPVSPYLAKELQMGIGVMAGQVETPYTRGGRAPGEGSLLRNEALADTLERIGAEGPVSFYEGAVGEGFSDLLRGLGGHILPEDLASHRSTWTEPITRSHFGLDLAVFPPNSQGLAYLQQLELAVRSGIADLAAESAPYLHSLVEIKKLVFADRNRWIGDPDFSAAPVDGLLDPEYLDARLRLLNPDRAMVAPPVDSSFGTPGTNPHPRPGGDTVFLTAVDGEGNAVSWIQSIFSPFGSGLYEPRTGVLFHNRGAAFTLEDRHPNRVAPGKRPFHTLSPIIATRNRELAFTLGTPGADGQTQTLLQVTLNLLQSGLDPQKAIDAPRYRSFQGLDLAVETRFHEAALRGLRKRGHEVRAVGPWAPAMGGAQMILVEKEPGGLTAAADPRREAFARVL